MDHPNHFDSSLFEKSQLQLSSTQQMHTESSSAHAYAENDYGGGGQKVTDPTLS